MSKNKQIKIGVTYEIRTFTGVVVHMKALRWYNDTIRTYCEGCLLRVEDVKALKKASVPYDGSEDPTTCVGILYDFQIVREVNKKRRNKRRPKTRKKIQGKM